jgi:hypothetical protein
MKKLKLKALSLGAREILTREQLRSIHGAGDACSDARDCGALEGHCVNGYCQSSTVGGGSASGGGNVYATSSGDQGTCSGTQYPCSCGNTSLGCLDPGQCTATVCQN